MRPHELIEQPNVRNPTDGPRCRMRRKGCYPRRSTWLQLGGSATLLLTLKKRNAQHGRLLRRDIAMLTPMSLSLLGEFAGKRHWSGSPQRPCALSSRE